MEEYIKIIVYIFAGIGAGIGTGFAGLSAAAFIAPMLVAFLDFPSYDAIGIALISDVLASAVSATAYAVDKNIDVKKARKCLSSFCVLRFSGVFLRQKSTITLWATFPFSQRHYSGLNSSSFPSTAEIP